MLLNKFYATKSATITSRDPPYVTPFIKSLMRKKNKLMRVGKIEQAGAISLRIGAEIISNNSGRLHAESKEAGSKDLWGAVREITGKKRSSLLCNNNFNADILNTHYASVSLDSIYTPP